MCKSWLLVSGLLPFTVHHGAAQTPSLQYATLYSFTGQNGDGATPAGSLAIGASGHIYGTTEFGGAGACKVNNQTGCGTVFELSPSGSPGSGLTETVLYSFTAQNGDGAYPSGGGLIIDGQGALYGTTGEGGDQNDGTVFVLKPPVAPSAQWTETILHSFAGGERDGSSPAGSLVFGKNGVIYGVTQYGGKQHLGTVFALQPPAKGSEVWAEKVLFSFTGQGDAGVSPSAGVAVGANGTLYGTALGYAGVAFALHAGAGGPWTESVLYAFGSQPGDGGTPYGGVVMGNNGKLYGTNNAGGPPSNICVPPVAGCGTVFELTPAPDGGNWTEKVIYAFTSAYSDGANPVAGVVIGPGGVLYGTTTDGPGAVFQLAPPTAPGGVWTETVLHTFTGQNGDGSDPVDNLAIGPNGAIYGTTVGGGTAGLGTVFALK